jgi:hypothetical protein
VNSALTRQVRFKVREGTRVHLAEAIYDAGAEFTLPFEEAAVLLRKDRRSVEVVEVIEDRPDSLRSERKLP